MTSDPSWPSASTLLRADPCSTRRNAGLVGIPTYATSLTQRSSTSTPVAVRAALERFSTYSWSDDLDLAEVVAVVDYGDVHEPDGPEGRRRVDAALELVDPGCELLLALGGDNAATFAAMSAVARGELASWGLITLDAHLDVRDGESNGSPVRQLLEAGLDGSHVVQVGLGDFSNSAAYAQAARKAGVTVVPRFALRDASIEHAMARALAIAGEGGRSVYVDIDLDVADRAVAPACPAAAPGGLTADEVRRAARALARDARVRAVDITEVDVERDADDERTIRLAALLVLDSWRASSVAAHDLAPRRLGGHVRRRRPRRAGPRGGPG